MRVLGVGIGLVLLGLIEQIMRGISILVQEIVLCIMISVVAEDLFALYVNSDFWKFIYN